jgi:hypothetical protein
MPFGRTNRDVLLPRLDLTDAKPGAHCLARHSSLLRFMDAFTANGTVRACKGLQWATPSTRTNPEGTPAQPPSPPPSQGRYPPQCLRGAACSPQRDVSATPILSDTEDGWAAGRAVVPWRPPWNGAF